MSSKLNEDAMRSELAASGFFANRNPTPPDERSSVPSAARPDANPGAGSTVRTPVRRVVTRYSFEFFQDQVEELRRRSLEQKLNGEDGSMSQMVREAIDAYLRREEASH